MTDRKCLKCITSRLLIRGAHDTRHTKEIRQRPDTKTSASDPVREEEPDLAHVDVVESNQPEHVGDGHLLLFLLVLVEESVL